MPLQTFQVTADIPEGYEPTGEFRDPNEGEWYLDLGGDLKQSIADQSWPLRIILRSIWQWPEFIRPGIWIAMESDGRWHAFSAEPELAKGPDPFWHMAGRGAAFSLIDPGAYDWTPPPCTDFRKSKRQKPL